MYKESLCCRQRLYSSLMIEEDLSTGRGRMLNLKPRHLLSFVAYSEICRELCI